MAVSYEVAESIISRKSQYCRYLDTKQWDLLESVFAPDPSLTYYDTEGQVAMGRYRGGAAPVPLAFDSAKGFTALMAKVLDGARTSHRFGNPELTAISAGETRAVFAMEDRLVFRGKDGASKTMIGCGHYHEVWVAHGDGWLLRRLQLKRTILQFVAGGGEH